ncbi:MAG: twin-arginine translocase subunit TatB [Betaproteobacteria bacterium]|nr:twin-arginine translocase subunit TatB [Betaproteobacteria bacterium]
MFDIGFSELLVIGVVALIVIGPERLPKVARTAGSLIGRLNRYVSQVKQDVERDIQLDELRKAQKEMQETAQKYEIMAEETGQAVKAEAGQVEKTIAAMSATDGGLAAAMKDLEALEELQEPPIETAKEEEPQPQQAQMELLLDPTEHEVKKAS